MERPRMLSIVLAACVMTSLAAGCGSPDQPRPLSRHFALDSKDSRLYERYGASGPSFMRTVRLKRGVTSVLIHFDCTKSNGTLSVGVTGFGTAGLACTGDHVSPGLVELGNLTALKDDDTAKLRVTAPTGSHWSIAVDASTAATG